MDGKFATNVAGSPMQENMPNMRVNGANMIAEDQESNCSLHKY